MCGCGCKMCGHHIGWIQGMRTGWGGARKADSRAPRKDANHRAELRSRDAAAHWLERNVHEAFGVARQDWIHQPKRRSMYGDSRLEPIDPTRIQRVHFHRLHG